MKPEYMEKLAEKLSKSEPLDVAVFACLTSAFWATARLGELTVQNLQAFNPESHVKRSDLGEKIDEKGNRTVTMHVPKTKASPLEGETLYWAKRNGPLDPDSALQKHLKINNPPNNFHLFGYKSKGKMIPLTRRSFLLRLGSAAKAAKLEALPGHSIRIGSTAEYLMKGLSFELMKVKGRWKSDAFHRYIRDHAMVLAPYMQEAPPETNDRFISIAIPPVRD